MATPRSPPTTMVLMPITPPSGVRQRSARVAGGQGHIRADDGHAAGAGRAWQRCPSEEMTPPVTKPRCPHGCPTARTTCPTFKAARIGQQSGGQIGFFNLQQGQVDLGVLRYQPGRELASIRQADARSCRGR